jgi:hypothetical protein
VGTKSNESNERVGVATPAAPLQPSIVKVLGSMVRLHLGGLDLPLIEPSHEVGNQSDGRPGGRRGASLSLQLLGEQLSERRKRTGLRKPARVLESLSHDHLQSHHEAWLAMTLFRVRFDARLRLQGARGTDSAYSRTRNSAESLLTGGRGAPTLINEAMPSRGR